MELKDGKRVFVVDGKDFTDYEGFVAVFAPILREAGLWPEEKGRWDGGLIDLNEALMGWVSWFVPDGFVLRWKNSELSRERLGNEEMARYYEEGLSETEGEDPSWHEARLRHIQRTREGLEQSLFEALVRTFEFHGPGWGSSATFMALVARGVLEEEEGESGNVEDGVELILE